MNIQFCILFLFSFSIASFGKSTSHKIKINQQNLEFQDSISILPYLDILSDVDEHLLYGDIKSFKENFHLVETNSLLIDDKNTHWLRFSLENLDSTAQQYVLFLGHEQQLEVFGLEQVHKLGTMIPMKDKFGNVEPGYYLRDDGFSAQLRLEIPAHTSQELYIKSTRVFNKALPVSIQLFSVDFWEQEMKTQTRHFNQGLFQGIILGFILYHLILFFMIRDRVYLFFCLYMFCIMVLTLGDFGYLQSSVLPNHPYLAWGIFLAFQYIAGIMTFFFMQHFVNLKALMPVWNQRVTWFIWSNIALFFLFAIIYFWTQNFNIIQLQKVLIVPFAIAGFLFCVLLIRSKDTVALYFAVAGAILSLGVAGNAILELLEQSGRVLETPYFRYYLMQVATTAHLLTFSIGMGYRSRQIELQNQRSIELDQLKTQLYTNITHEFRTPLTVIMGVSENLKGDQQAKRLIQRNSQNLLRLINQLLDLSKLDAGYLQVNNAQGNIIHYLEYLTESFYSMATERQIRLTFYTEIEELVMDFDEEKIQHIVYNLISNAIKFTPKGGKVVFHVKRKEGETQDFLEMNVKDNGIGIAAEQLPSIFDRFYQIDHSSTRKEGGTGIGLALTKELIELMHGKIEVISQLNKGTTFNIYLPITNSAPFNEHTVPLIQPKDLSVSEEAPFNFASKNRPILLIVEDNLDVRIYIQSLLKDQYQIITAEDGEEGIKKALERIPDIIISDVMMPKKNGYEVCEYLKQDKRTSHIPIILLTAKATQEDKIEGLQFGADAFLIKPFHKKELMVRLENLVSLRQELQERYTLQISDSQLLDSSEMSDVSNLENTFLSQLRAVVEAKMNRSDFQIANLAANMNMSQVQVYRKLKALTGQTPSKFVRSIRLQKAKVLLTNSDLTISEIAYDIGFADPSYFSRTFQQEFGTSPRDFRN